MTDIRKSALALALLAPMGIAACVPASDPVVVPTSPATETDACGSAAYQQFVGQKSPAISLPAGAEFRHYRAGDPVTLDLRPERLNFEYDRSGTLIRVSCG
ncbi:I78 family peptidase inhibitor [Paracoccus jeotgali]|uniref:I78 family peptidase inhibitor n=1 Tax=Paracoccus jeotgali TaxID=2065379 RepID=UPI0028A6E47E|nr:I78 family peptidase inhibitor [Paracoccus jeotgali]